MLTRSRKRDREPEGPPKHRGTFTAVVSKSALRIVGRTVTCTRNIPGGALAVARGSGAQSVAGEEHTFKIDHSTEQGGIRIGVIDARSRMWLFNPSTGKLVQSTADDPNGLAWFNAPSLMWGDLRGRGTGALVSIKVDLSEGCTRRLTFSINHSEHTEADHSLPGDVDPCVVLSNAGDQVSLVSSESMPHLLSLGSLEERARVSRSWAERACASAREAKVAVADATRAKKEAEAKAAAATREKKAAEAREAAAIEARSEAESRVARQVGERAALQKMSLLDLELLETAVHESAARIRAFVAERRAQEGRCGICWEHRKNTVLVPCGHVYCGECVKQLRLCPECRAPIQQRQRAFL